MSCRVFAARTAARLNLTPAGDYAEVRQVESGRAVALSSLARKLLALEAQPALLLAADPASR